MTGIQNTAQSRAFEAAAGLRFFQSARVPGDADAALAPLKALLAAASEDEVVSLLGRAGLDFYIERPYGLAFFLLCETRSQWALDRIISYLARRSHLGEFSDVFWNVSRLCHTDRVIDALDFRGLRREFLSLSDRVRAQAPPPRHRPGRELRRVAILSPQILSLHHSPTREALQIALRLKQDHDLEVVVFNLNGMSYSNELGLIAPFIANHNPALSGCANLATGLIEFTNAEVTIVNFPAERLSAGKLFDVVEWIDLLEIDFVISHGENHFFQDMMFGRLPSLFATTGAVLPYGRSNAYWAPGSLVTDDHEALAAEFGAGPILREQMFTSPENITLPAADRALLGIEPDAVVFIVVGTRLSLEVDADFAAVAQSLLNTVPGSILLFLGSADLDLAQFFDGAHIDRGRVRNLGFRDDVVSLCKAADIYLNPRRSGGGTSAQTAILCGAPVVTLAFGHISDIVPSDRRFENFAAYADYARQLGNRADFRRSEAERFQNYLTDTAAPSSQVNRLVSYMKDLHLEHSAVHLNRRMLRRF